MDRRKSGKSTTLKGGTVRSRIGMFSLLAGMTAFAKSGYTVRMPMFTTRKKLCPCGARYQHPGKFCSHECYGSYKRDVRENRDQTHRTRKYRESVERWNMHISRFPWHMIPVKHSSIQRFLKVVRA